MRDADELRGLLRQLRAGFLRISRTITAREKRGELDPIAADQARRELMILSFLTRDAERAASEIR